MIYFMFLLFFTNFGGSNRQAKKVWQITKITIIARMCRKNIKNSAKAVLTSISAFLLCISAYSQNSWNDYAPARNLLTEEKLENQIGFLADSLCQGRGIGTRGGVETSSWVAREFEKAGLLKIDSTWFKSFVSEKGDYGRNVVGMLPGGNPDCSSYIIVGAHFDHLGTLDGKHYPGADANASGTVALTNIAEMLSVMKDTVGKRYASNIIFIGFDGKEADMAGSKAIWNMISSGQFTDPVTGKAITSKQISLMVNIDQIGASLSPLRPDRPDYIIMLGNHRIKPSKRDQLYMCNRLYITHLDLGFDYYGSENFTKIFYRLSDQRVFIDHGIPSVLFTSGITMKTNKTYDNAASLDYPVLRKRILLMFHWIEKML